jgi:uncharacterized protein
MGKMRKTIQKVLQIYKKTGVYRHLLIKQFFFFDAYCRFAPTCSEYSAQAIEKYGLVKGSMMGLRRVAACNPFGKSGYDPLV